MSEGVAIPQEAIRAITNGRASDRTRLRNVNSEQVRRDLEDAAPHLRTTYRAELEEELLSDEAVEKFAALLFEEDGTMVWAEVTSESNREEWREQVRQRLDPARIFIKAALSIAGEGT